jgi:hypothetical protein
VSARDHRDRFKDGAHHASLQENERRTMRPGLEGKSFMMGARSAVGERIEVRFPRSRPPTPVASCCNSRRPPVQAIVAH